jgi:hypothetical protein
MSRLDGSIRAFEGKPKMFAATPRSRSARGHDDERRQPPALGSALVTAVDTRDPVHPPRSTAQAGAALATHDKQMSRSPSASVGVDIAVVYE